MPFEAAKPSRRQPVTLDAMLAIKFSRPPSRFSSLGGSPALTGASRANPTCTAVPAAVLQRITGPSTATGR